MFLFSKQLESDAVLQGAPKWMSCWASLADGLTEGSSLSGTFDMSAQMDLSGAGEP